MRRGRRTHAAGPASTGTAPIPPLKNRSLFGTEFRETHPAARWLALTQEGWLAEGSLSGPPYLYPKTAPCSLTKLDFAQFAANRHTRISNRHLVRLETTATPSK